MPSGSLRETCTRVLPHPFRLNAIYTPVKSLRCSVVGASSTMRTRASSNEAYNQIPFSPTAVNLLFLFSPPFTIFSPSQLLAFALDIFVFASNVSKLERKREKSAIEIHDIRINQSGSDHDFKDFQDFSIFLLFLFPF